MQPASHSHVNARRTFGMLKREGKNVSSTVCELSIA